MAIIGLINLLAEGLDFLQKVAPLAEAAGVPHVGQVANIGGALLEIGENVVKRVEEGKIVASETEAANIKAIVARIAEENDNLANQIAQS